MSKPTVVEALRRIIEWGGMTDKAAVIKLAAAAIPEAEAQAARLRALEAEVAEFRKDKERLRDDLFHLREWLAYKLGTAATYIPNSDKSGHPHGWTAVQIPDWDVKQKLEAIDAAMKEASE